MPIIPPEVMEEDWNFASSSETQVATGVSGSTEITRYVIVVPYFIFSLGIKLLPTYLTGFGDCEVPVI